MLYIVRKKCIPLHPKTIVERFEPLATTEKNAKNSRIHYFARCNFSSFPIRSFSVGFNSQL